MDRGGHKMPDCISAATRRCITILLVLTTLCIAWTAPTVNAILQDGGERQYDLQHPSSISDIGPHQGGSSTSSSSVGSEGYFDGSAHAIVKSTLHIRHMTSLGFRTCANGLLFYQSGAGGDSLKLEVVGNTAVAATGNGSAETGSGSRLRLKWEVGGIDGWAEVGQRLNDNRWHQVLLRYALGAVTLVVDHQEALVANATHHPELLKLDLISPNPEVVVGQGFKGCLLQGAGLVFNDSSVVSVGVSWARCPMPNRGGCDGYQVDYCFSQPCHKFGVCISLPDDYLCQCTTRYTGRNCETDTGPLCDREEFSRCRNGGVCQENKTGNSTLCACPPKFTGQFCETVIDGRLCDTNPCLNNATCHVNRFGDGYECSCQPGFAGLDCEVNIDECASSPCQHGGTCSDGVDAYTCRCHGTGYRGTHCELNIDECAETRPCRHQGRCFDNYGSYFCECPPGFLGKDCDKEADECASAPCLNGATCRNQFNRYECICAPGFQGTNCEVNIDDCANIKCPLYSHCVDKINTFQCACDLGYTGVTPNCTEIDECAARPCQNGATCQDLVGSHRCICPDGYAGLNCSEDIDECLSSPCLNGGTCVDGVGTFICECPAGFLGPNCSRDVDECISSPCLNGGQCTDKVGGYECHCPVGWNGSRCEIDIDECVPSPCQNRGRCEDTIGDYNCNCLKPWGGKNCDLNSEPCLSEPCRHNATCTNGQPAGNYTCHCLAGFAGDTCDMDLDECLSNPCSNGGHCTDRPGTFTCRCPAEYGGLTCAELYDDCVANPCHHGATCHTQLLQRNSTCACVAGFTGARCETRIEGCAGVTCPFPHVCRETASGEVGHVCECPAGFEGDNCERDIDECVAGFCTNGGTCVDGVGNATCRCPTGFHGSRCDQDVDECNPGVNSTSPCQWGICKNTRGSFQCYCQPGYTGTFCHQEFDECLTQPCRHGGTCRDLVATYKCLCPIGYTGKNCETDINECSSNPCANGASCVDGVGAFVCRCQPGFAGLLCEQDIDECASAPCLHAGQCVDHVNAFSCNCSDTGFRGDVCEENIDECASNPCQNEAHCLDLVKDYNCQCHPGFEGKNCESDIAECETGPCRNGGECLEKSNTTVYGLGDSLRPPGFPRGPYRHATAGGYICQCPRGFVGNDCEINVDDCESGPCQHGGACVDGIDAYTCDCRRGFEGRHCESEIDECRRYRPCATGSTCHNEFGDYMCSCVPGFGGKNCTVTLMGCEHNDCHNGAACVPYLIGEDNHRRNCTCGHGFHGDVCQHSTAMSFDGGAHYMLNVMGVASRPYTLSLRFRTTLPSGFLAMAYGLSHSFRLFLSDGVLHFNMPDANLSTSLGERLNDGRWRTIRVAVTAAGVHLELGNGEVTSRNVQLTFGRETRIVPHFSRTDVGGIEQWMRGSGMVRVPNYVGCMEDVEVSGSRVVPGMDPVEVGSPGISYPGNVLRGCARTEQCLPATCNGGGQCVDLWTNYTCQCLRPRYGLHCEHEYEAVTFSHENSSNSYAEILLPGTIRDKLRNNATVSLFLRTRQPDGLLFYLGNGNSLDGAGEEDTFLAAQLQGGVLRLSVKINGTPESLLDKSNRRLDDGYYHFLQVSLLNRTLSALLNGTTLINNMEVDAHRDRHLKATNLFLGGLGSPGQSGTGLRSRRQFSEDPLFGDLVTDIPSELDMPPPPSNTPAVNPAIFFKGVMQDVRLNDLLVEVFPMKRELIPMAQSVLRGNVTKVNILEGVQSDDSCHHSPCQSGSNCTVTWNDYHCECPTGFRGKNCSDLEFCAYNNCPAQSECRSLANGYECIANATFNGINSSVSYTLISDQATIPLNQISINFRTQHGGPVLHVSRGGDFFGLYLANWTTLRLRWSAAEKGIAAVAGNAAVGEESTTIPILTAANEATINNEALTAGDNDQWHSLQVTIGDTVSVRVDGGEPIMATADGATLSATLQRMAANTGTADEPQLTVVVGAGASADHYRGCLGEVRLGGVLLPFFPRSELANDTSATYYKATMMPHMEVGDCLLCYDSECQHGSVCQDRRDSRRCNCSRGYEGQFCEVNVDECAGVTCDNGGTCQDGVAAFRCQCVPGYEGERCELDIDECASDPCQNGGRCDNLLDSYNCNCTANYTGINCEKEKAFDCSTHPCHAGATCINANVIGQETPGFQCVCPVGRTGVVCESEIDFCLSNECAGGSTCQNEPSLGRFRCHCVTGFEGRLCADKIDYCKSAPCQHDGVCQNEANSYSCNCTPNYTGSNCETDVNECASEVTPCQNDAQCINEVGDYQCVCNDTFVGKNCDIPNPCIGYPCNVGSCYANYNDTDATPVCNCSGTDYMGPNCEKKVEVSVMDAEMLGIVIGSVVAATILIVIGVLTVFLTMAKKKRATRGTYSPSRQEMFGSRVEMGNVMKPPPEERLI